ncbi:MAG: bifunctional folylpolyglutamate synthase/dihydrofolate synthase [Solirubrobacterales bacterium]
MTEATPERSTGEWFDSLAEVGWRPGLERMGPLMEALGSPQDRYRTVHVVGTNGKTSTTLYGAALLDAAGVLAGSHTSPHLTDWTERTRVSGEPIGAAAWEAALERVRPAVDQVEAALPEYGSLTQFEVATAAAFVALADAGVEAAMIEAGMGGRLDSTNVIPSEVTVLTSIGLDHTEWLGETELEIAGEKLAVLRPGTRLVVGPLGPEVGELAARTAAERGCELVEVGDPGTGPATPLGRYARIDFALALAAVEPFTGPIDEATRLLALDRAGVRGRLEITGSNPPVVFDVAHNRDGIEAVAEALEEVIGDRPLAVVFGCLSDRDPVQLLEPLVARTAVLFPCQAPHLVGSRAREGLPAERVGDAGRELGIEVEVHPVPVEALDAARSAASSFGGAVLVCGSHGLVAALAPLQP